MAALLFTIFLYTFGRRSTHRKLVSQKVPSCLVNRLNPAFSTRKFGMLPRPSGGPSRHRVIAFCFVTLLASLAGIFHAAAQTPQSWLFVEAIANGKATGAVTFLRDGQRFSGERQLRFDGGCCNRNIRARFL
jgi:hypothetical protein